MNKKNADLFQDIDIRWGIAGLTEENLVRLWHSVGWYNGSATVPDKLLSAMQNSSTVFTAWHNEELIGLCSVIDDGLNAWISYMVVDSAYQNNAIGSVLVDKMIERYAGFRVFVQTMHAAEFYKQHAFVETMTSLKIDNL